ncbi:TetR/AcrR family transcriptional regulator [Nonomuraea cavernae]|uniref:TetR family transcriptional regulator n=1 Tax=Nonomuraea cavernae TaxID=2045107 RepID=A0A917YNI1_9ACTN|nr:TetR/AcrR family transcriptional regulator [Nonomuraea cavernae]MCA2183484.1 TetR/AcrR family transcriptional regulator [Nonomuraea cavernae]GGO60435.1 TetR family transcriptional regulator [Nonomuraea cavernae]
MSPESQPAARRRGRPAKRQLIVDAARRVFLRHGYTDTSIEMIAAEAEASKQTIYNHFEGKEQLFAAVVRAVQQSVMTDSETLFAARFTETGDVEQDLRAAFRLMTELNLSGDVAAFRRLVTIEQLRHPELMREWTQPRPAFESFVAAEIRRQTACGALDVPDSALAARQLITLILNEAINQSRYGLRILTEAEIGRIVDDGVDFWLRAYRADGSR